MSAQHTPTPWFVYLNGKVSAEPRHLGMHGAFHTPVANCSSANGWIADDAAREADNAKAAANAEFIVRACNSHDALVKALHDVMPLLAECDCIHSDRTDMLCPCKAARAAIAAAEGK